MELLVESDRSVSDLLVQMELEPSSLSQHLAVLKRVGLVESRRSGNAVTYRLTDPSVGGIFAAAKTVLKANLGRTRQVLEDLEGD